MKELNDREQLSHHLRLHQLENVFGGRMQAELALGGFEPGEVACAQGGSPQQLCAAGLVARERGGIRIKGPDRLRALATRLTEIPAPTA